MFNLFKKKPQPEKMQPPQEPGTGPFASQEQEAGPFASLTRAIDLLPEFYRTEPAFSACLSLIANRDPQAVESLIGLTKLEGHYFSDPFWREVAACASQLDLPDQAAYCNRQMERNARELGQKLQPGWTMEKTGPSSYTSHITQSIRDGWEDARRNKHNVSKLLKQNGFHMVSDGREGMLYYVKDGRLMEFYVELSGDPKYSIIVHFDRVTGYVYPKRIPVTEEEKQKLKAELEAWLRRKGYRALLG
jgi:hypothetical protein